VDRIAVGFADGDVPEGAALDLDADPGGESGFLLGER